MIINYFQVPVCEPEMFECMENISFNSSSCLSSCEGLIVNSYVKKTDKIHFGSYFAKLLEQYNSFLQPTWLPPLLKSKLENCFSFLQTNQLKNTNPLSQNTSGRTNSMWLEFFLTLQSLTELPKTGLPSLQICCQLLEEPWVFSQGSQ